MQQWKSSLHNLSQGSCLCQGDELYTARIALTYKENNVLVLNGEITITILSVIDT